MDKEKKRWGGFRGMFAEMHFYVTKTTDGLYHVQNAVMGMLGQHHVHTEKGFKKWMREIEKEKIHTSSGNCDCGLRAGNVQDHTGNVTFNRKFV